MFSLSSGNSYYLYRHPTDMRKSFDGLTGIVKSQMQKNPLSGEVFLFINRRNDRIKLLRWEKGGFVLYYKRLEKGTLSRPANRKEGVCHAVSWPELVMIIEGIVVEKYRQKARFQPR
jgi:transposase